MFGPCFELSVLEPSGNSLPSTFHRDRMLKL
jgi:hypothetical protein